LAPSQLADGWLAERIVRLLTETGFAAERLVVEITETSLFADIDLARTIVASHKNQGVRLALDDFGTGFSSLAHLRSLPFDLIKIDRSFVTNIYESSQSAAIVRAIATLATALDVPILVEGIESEAAHAAVLALGCSSGQGWYFGKPVEGAAAASCWRSGQSVRLRPPSLRPAPRRASSIHQRRPTSRSGTAWSDSSKMDVLRMVKQVLRFAHAPDATDACCKPGPLRPARTRLSGGSAGERNGC
jgi:predicted signal transduction protein with EAL and GGDEF domain